MTTVSPEQTADTLTRAADYIETHGWQHGRMSGPDGSVCAMGALRSVSPPGRHGRLSDEESTALAAIARYLELRPDPANPSPRAAEAGNLVTAWNDRAGNADEVITAMRQTAKHLTGGTQ